LGVDSPQKNTTFGIFHWFSTQDMGYGRERRLALIMALTRLDFSMFPAEITGR
jgi:hypothetical protein